MDDQLLINVCVVGDTPLSAFLTWRLQAANICDLTLVWNSGFNHIQSYGLSFKSLAFGEHRFKPRIVIPTVDELSGARYGAPKFEYVILSPSTRDEARALIARAPTFVTPNHTCILVDTSKFIGLESALRKAFANNLILSLFSVADVVADSEPGSFYHRHGTTLYISPLMTHPTIAIDDVLGTLTATLNSVEVDCQEVPDAARTMLDVTISNTVFHTSSVVFDTIHYGDMLQRIGVRGTIGGMIDEMVDLAAQLGCKFSPTYRDTLMASMSEKSQAQGAVPNPLWDAFRTKQSMNLDTYFAFPLTLAHERGITLPRVEMMSAILRHQNYMNTRSRMPRNMSASRAPSVQGSRPSLSNSMLNMNGHGPRPWSKGTPSPNAGFDPRYGSRPGQPSRRPMSRIRSTDANNQAISSVSSSIDNLADLGSQSHHYPAENRRSGTSTVPVTPSSVYGGPEDEPFDMLMLTSRRTRAARLSNSSPNQQDRSRRQKSPQSHLAMMSDIPSNHAMMNDIPSVHATIRDSAFFRNCSSNRYGNVDRIESSRANSIKSTTQWDPNHLPASRRSSQSPGHNYPANTYGSSSRVNGSSDAIPFHPQTSNGKPFGSDMRFPPMNSHPRPVAPPDIGLGSNPYPSQKGIHNRSLTGSASASAGSGESTLDSPAQSSSSSLNKGGNHPAVVGVR